MASKVLSVGIFKAQCRTCKCWVEYVYADTHQRIGEGQGNMALNCPSCGNAILHDTRNYIATRPLT